MGVSLALDHGTLIRASRAQINARPAVSLPFGKCFKCVDQFFGLLENRQLCGPFQRNQLRIGPGGDKIFNSPVEEHRVFGAMHEMNAVCLAHARQKA